jgi:hypothetical protein
VIGADALIARRTHGAPPGIVWLDADAAPVPDGEDNDAHAHLWLGKSNPRRVDLRCVIGLTVYVSGPDRETVFALRDRCIAAKAQRVIASVLIPRGSGDWTAYHLDETTDTDGILTWPTP